MSNWSVKARIVAARRPLRPSALGLAALVGAVAALHGLALGAFGGLGWHPGVGTPLAGSVLQVRSIVVPVVTPSEPPAPRPAPVSAPARRRVEPAPAPAAEPSDPMLATPPPSTPPPAPAVVQAAEAAPPVYRTALPPDIRWDYSLTRGGMPGSGSLTWHREGDRYEARLEGSVAGFNVFEWSSSGQIDAAGIAPQRFVDKRMRRGAVAANFQRAAGKITYSGASGEVPLPAGSQDRLSWMLQLSGILAAQPTLAAPGSRVAMFVSGARADADVWTFTVRGRESLDGVGGGTVSAVMLQREPRKPYDTRVEVWLDPGRHYLPVRMRLSNGDSVLELALRG